jgi:hypothetical protein
MNRAHSKKQHWAWLLAALMFSPVWVGLVARVHPPAAGCTLAAHACCCVKAGIPKCACDGHGGAAAQLVSLSTCAGAQDLPAFLLALPPAAPAPVSETIAPPRVASAVPLMAPVFPPSSAPQPATPPPQAA